MKFEYKETREQFFDEYKNDMFRCINPSCEMHTPFPTRQLLPILFNGRKEQYILCCCPVCHEEIEPYKEI
jgi:hypothetical protein